MDRQFAKWPQAAVFLGKGDGTFQNPTAIVTTAYLPSIGIVDFNGDGNPDLLLGDCCGLTEAVIMPGNGDGTFQTGTAFLSGPNPSYLAVADFDGDGKPDLAIAGKNNVDATLVVLRNATPSVAKAAVVSSANPASTAIAPNSLADAFGSDLANSQPAATPLPLPTSFGGTSVSIDDSSGATSAAPLLYVSASQVNFLVPSSTIPIPEFVNRVPVPALSIGTRKAVEDRGFGDFEVWQPHHRFRGPSFGIVLLLLLHHPWPPQPRVDHAPLQHQARPGLRVFQERRGDDIMA